MLHVSHFKMSKYIKDSEFRILIKPSTSYIISYKSYLLKVYEK